MDYTDWLLQRQDGFHPEERAAVTSQRNIARPLAWPVWTFTSAGRDTLYVWTFF